MLKWTKTDREKWKTRIYKVFQFVFIPLNCEGSRLETERNKTNSKTNSVLNNKRDVDCGLTGFLKNYSVKPISYFKSVKIIQKKVALNTLTTLRVLALSTILSSQNREKGGKKKTSEKQMLFFTSSLSIHQSMLMLFLYLWIKNPVQKELDLQYVMKRKNRQTEITNFSRVLFITSHFLHHTIFFDRLQKAKK